MYICAMLMKMRNFTPIAIVFVLLLSSCSDYNKIVKSTDYEFKYKKSLEYYEAGEFVRSSTLLKELLNIYRGTSRADKVYYYYAKSQFGMKDNMMAGHYFKTLVKEFPRSEYAEESQFMVGYCFYLDSPNARLDQQVSQNAIDALQLFINLYPKSTRVEEANRLIIELRDKLVYKSYISGKLYYDLKNYKAAVVALSSSLKDFPDTKYREELMYMLVKEIESLIYPSTSSLVISFQSGNHSPSSASHPSGLSGFVKQSGVSVQSTSIANMASPLILSVTVSRCALMSSMTSDGESPMITSLNGVYALSALTTSLVR